MKKDAQPLRIVASFHVNCYGTRLGPHRWYRNIQIQIPRQRMRFIACRGTHKWLGLKCLQLKYEIDKLLQFIISLQVGCGPTDQINRMVTVMTSVRMPTGGRLWQSYENDGLDEAQDVCSNRVLLAVRTRFIQQIAIISVEWRIATGNEVDE